MIRIPTKIFPKNFFAKRMSANAQRYSALETEWVGNYLAYVPAVIKKDVLQSFMKMRFEDQVFNVPVKYDELLTALYGDYMKLPPEEQRKTHHTFEAYIED